MYLDNWKGRKGGEGGGGRGRRGEREEGGRISERNIGETGLSREGSVTIHI